MNTPPKKDNQGHYVPVLSMQFLRFFLGKYPGRERVAEMRRSNIMKKIIHYIREHSLVDPNDERLIRQDAALKKLLHIPKGSQLTFFNLQTYLIPHIK